MGATTDIERDAIELHPGVADHVEELGPRLDAKRPWTWVVMKLVKPASAGWAPPAGPAWPTTRLTRAAAGKHEHGQPDGRGGSCPLLEVDGRKGGSVRHVRRAARAFADLAQWGRSVRLVLKRPPRSAIDTQRLLPGSSSVSVTDRQRIAVYLSMLNRQTGVRPLVTWEKRLSVTYSDGGLLGVLAVLLTCEIAARDDLSYNCSVCGRWSLAEGHQPDEAIYCTKE